MLIRTLAAVFLLAPVLVGGCGSSSASPGSGAPRPTNATLSIIALGAGVPDPGYSGYIIAANTGAYRVTWTGDRIFQGSVFADTGGLGQFFPGCTDGSCALATGEDQVIVGAGDPGRIDFVSYPVSGKRSGFDVTVPDGKLIIDLLIDGARVPSRVEFVSGDPQTPGQTVTAPDMPLELVGQ